MSSFAMFCCLAWSYEALICTAALHPQGTMGNVAVAQILRSRWGILRSTELRRVATISSSNPAPLETGQSTATSSRMRKTAKKNAATPRTKATSTSTTDDNRQQTRINSNRQQQKTTQQQTATTANNSRQAAK